MDLRSERIVNYLIHKFPEIGKTILMKVVYIGEIMSIEENGERLTNTTFIHYDYGPFSTEVADIWNLSNKNQKVSLTGISKKKINIINKLLEEITPYAQYNFKGSLFDSLMNKAYKTRPFLETDFKEVINFEDYIGKPFISKVVINSKDYKKLSNPDYKPRSSKAKKNLDDLMEFFDTNEQ
jgi:hypothetical protein